MLENERPAFVSVSNLSKHYRTGLWRKQSVQAVNGISFDIAKGEAMGLVGESGCGKSTVARLLTKLTTATGGSVSVDGRDVLRLGSAAEELSKKRLVQLVFQDPVAALDPRMTLGQSLAAPLARHGIRGREERSARVRRILTEVGLEPSFADKLPGQCSGGQLQRAVIARALLLNPQFLVCDEPTSALDASLRTLVLNLLVTLRRDFNLTLLMISHDLNVVRFLCDKIAVMYLGEIVEYSPTENLFAFPKHPYTRGLIAASCLGRSEGRVATDDSVKGEPPSPLNPPQGCYFHPRCIHATEICRHEAPKPVSTSSGGLVRCHHWKVLSYEKLR
ncbi:peptide/nickel transport system ATP-binding protein [Aminobacter aminovorans]|jgi:oligopeptide/dipeptide ABC transporter ATP-binding protein|uniref:Peptide ABC transporter ATP-binding protein n=2 Tax=Aminobacter aminovorans TaxID=83263 RepID=A0AAC9FEP7_AMIAI|nr:ABC transporter ATP-binding protein [Aminobacter aminovorans]AMS44957.1 peptide ABC transporter ATP-binding protein [Aminobacter aminovorans]MBB3709792.1 peptide/nickel transport system ATP-binding protein [Aminobacter aminovorans]